MIRNNKNPWVFHPSPTARGHAKVGEYFEEMRNREIAVLDVRADCDSDFEALKVPKPKHEGIRAKMGK